MDARVRETVLCSEPSKRDRTTGNEGKSGTNDGAGEKKETM
jgi:hypothetical protein